MQARSYSLAIALICTLFCKGQTQSIHLNQIGFYPSAPKIAVIAPSISNTRFFILDLAKGDTVFRGQLGASRPNPLSGKSSQIADFSSLQKPGKFQLHLADGTHSFTFSIAAAVQQDLAKGVLKSYYFQRMSTALPVAYAGVWARPFGHPDDKVLVHPSAASTARPAGFEISAPGGWYDAGDYNKYVVNSGITTSTLLSLYEDFPEYCQKLNTGIPESQN